MALESSAISLTSNFYMKNYYRYNRNAIKVSGRSDYTESELSYEDTRALKRAVSKLDDFDYDSDENLANIISSVKAFAETVEQSYKDDEQAVANLRHSGKGKPDVGDGGGDDDMDALLKSAEENTEQMRKK